MNSARPTGQGTATRPVILLIAIWLMFQHRVLSWPLIELAQVYAISVPAIEVLRVLIATGMIFLAVMFLRMREWTRLVLASCFVLAVIFLCGLSIKFAVSDAILPLGTAVFLATSVVLNVLATRFLLRQDYVRLCGEFRQRKEMVTHRDRTVEHRTESPSTRMEETDQRRMFWRRTLLVLLALLPGLPLLIMGLGHLANMFGLGLVLFLPVMLLCYAYYWVPASLFGEALFPPEKFGYFPTGSGYVVGAIFYALVALVLSFPVARVLQLIALNRRGKSLRLQHIESNVSTSQHATLPSGDNADEGAGARTTATGTDGRREELKR